MVDPRDDLAAIADRAQRATTLPPAQAVRRRADRRRRRTVGAGVGLAVLAVAAGAALLPALDRAGQPDRGVAPAAETPAAGIPASASPSASATAAVGPAQILSGRRQVRIVVPGVGGAALAVGLDDDRVRATTESDVESRSRWVLRPEGDRFRIVVADPSGDPVCMTVVHDAAPGSVRARACDPAAQTQLFRVDRQADGSYSLFQGKRYVQVVDGTNALVPDLPEALTTTYDFEDQGPTPLR
ncbi:hypothetical protein ACFOOK_31755 [Micromonospora krabiensis]|uniref:Ricin B lectin domain-containing protein n=1 Tax=Micromonospora krabiensis TaxID=307121 RepID=A0A1C3MY67_9ACTN|nr:hypothetical protein [Micromonospora krabiensis]SBV25277.1 hypothetical protein GA0070620_0748 [Micromonospora krabiensis]